jgi:signal peptidase I
MTIFLFLLSANLGIFLLVIMFLMRSILLVVTVENRSMMPTLEAGDRVLMVRHWPTRWLRKGHIVLINPGYGMPARPKCFATPFYIKRIVALGGERLSTFHQSITDGTYPSEHNVGNEQDHWYIPAGYFFAQGDGPRSVDSRQWGALPLQSVRAVALMKLPHKARVHSTS